MAVKTGTSPNYLALLDELLDFLQSKAAIGTPVYTGTGNGTLNDLASMPSAVTETWTLEASNATKVGVADYGATVATDTPVLHWRFNEGSGTTAEDNTANNRDGTISGSPTMGSTGLLSVDSNLAMTFDGVNDQVASAAISAVQLTGDAAIEVIIRPTDITGTRFIAGVGAAGTGNANNYLISLWMVSGYLKIYHEYGAGNIQQVSTGFLCAVNRKYHIVLSRDSANKKYQLIVGGIVRHEFDYLFPPSDGTNSYFSVGLDPDGLYPFAGIIDEPALYNTQISAATAASHATDALGHETFTVTGSVSGAQADAVVGVPYQNAFLEFTIEDGSTNFIVGDDWSIGFTGSALGAQAWTINRREADKVFLQGPGLSGTDEIYCYIKTYSDGTADYYNWEIGAADGYSSSHDETEQPNASPPSYVPLTNNSMLYWFVANGRRFEVIAKVSTTYQGCYCGLYLPFATPLQFPYPMAVGGSSGTKINRWSSTGESARLFAIPGLGCLYARSVDGAWNQVSCTFDTFTNTSEADYVVHPYGARNSSSSKVGEIREGLNDIYGLTPLTIVDTTKTTLTKGVVGELDGCFHVSGFNNASENIVVDNLDDNYLVVQNVFRTGLGDYFAMRLT